MSTTSWPSTWTLSTSSSASTCSGTPGPWSSPSGRRPRTSSSSPRRSGDEDDPDVWAQASGALSYLDRVVDDDTRDLVASYARALLTPVLARLGWDARPGEGPRTPTLRAQVVGVLGIVGRDTDVQAEAHRRYAAAVRGEIALDPDLASAILGAVAASGGPEEFEDFLERYRHPATPQEEMRYLYALAGFPEPSLGGPGLRARPHRGAHAERAVRHPAPAEPPRQRAGHVGAGAGPLGRARRPHSRQHPAPHARGGDHAVPRPAARRRHRRLRPGPSPAHRSANRRPDARASRDQRVVRRRAARQRPIAVLGAGLQRLAARGERRPHLQPPCPAPGAGGRESVAER